MFPVRQVVAVSLWFIGAVLIGSCQKTPPPNFTQIFPQDSLIRYVGRFELPPEGPARFAWTGSQVLLTFTGTSCKLLLSSKSTLNDGYGNPQLNYFQYSINGEPPQLLPVPNDSSEFLLVEGLPDTTHTLSLFKRTEANTGVCEFKGLILDSARYLAEPPPLPSRKIEFIGNSITCGYGNEGDSARCRFSPLTENGYMAYGAITARMLDAQYVAIAASGKGVIRNYDTLQADIMPVLYQRIYPQNDSVLWDFRRWQPDAVVVNLGTNDQARGLPKQDDFVTGYAALLRSIRLNYPDAQIFCLLSPMLTDAYPARQKRRSTMATWIREAMVAAEEDTADLHFFALTEQGPLGYGCDFHPNLAQHRLNAIELADFMADKMGWKRAF